MNFPDRKTVERLREQFPVGCRIVLDCMTRLIEIIEPCETHYLNFFILERTSPDTDWSRHEVTMNLHFCASLACMGGESTPEDLLMASDIIRRGAELVKELEAMNLFYTETF